MLIRRTLNRLHQEKEESERELKKAQPKKDKTPEKKPIPKKKSGD